jgi:O-antigen/teichoic acid export membrane protein
MLVNTVMGFGGVMAFGLTDATIKFVSQYRARQQLQSVVRVIRATLAMYSVLGLLCGLALFFASPLLVTHVFRVLPGNQGLATTAIRLAGLGIAVRFIDSVFESSLQGHERYDLSARVSMVVNSLTILCNLYSVSRGHGLITVLVTIVAFQFGGATQKALAVMRLTRTAWIAVPKLSGPEMRETLGFGLYSWVQGISSISLSQVDRFLIASFLGTHALAYYAVCLQLAQQIHAIVAKALSFIFPLASGEKEKGNHKGLLLYFWRGMTAAAVIGTGGGVALFLNAHNILSVWMGRDFALAAAPTLRVLTLSFAILATSVVPFYYLNGAGYVRLNTLLGLTSGASVSAGALALIPLFGIVGAAWSRLCNLPAGVIATTVVQYRILEDRRWYAGILVYVPVLTTFGIAWIFLVNAGEGVLTVPMLLVRALCCFLGGALLAALQCFLIYNTGLARQPEAQPALT